MPDLTTANPFVSRLDGRHPVQIPLSTVESMQARKFKEFLAGGDIRFAPNPCMCGETDDVLIALSDRYTFDVRTVLCRKCGLMRTDPYMDHESLVTFYRDHYRLIYGGSTEPTEKHYVQRVEQGKELVKFLNSRGIKPTGTVLEIGCGSGGILTAFRELGCQVAGCDYDSAFLARGLREGLDLRPGGAEVLADVAPANMILLVHVLEHLPDPVKELRRIAALLAPDGLLVIEVPGVFNIHFMYGGNIGAYLQNAHVYHYCRETMDVVLARAGFERVAGNDWIRAIYRLRSIPPTLSCGEYDRILKYISTLESVRWMPSFLLRRVLKLVGRWYRVKLTNPVAVKPTLT